MNENNTKFISNTSSRRTFLGGVGAVGIAGVAGCSSLFGESADIRISGGVGPLPMVQVWAEKYEEETGIVIDIAGGGTGVGISDLTGDQVDVAMMGREPFDDEVDQGVYEVAILRDTVVGTINKDNPVRDEIEEQGLSRSDLEDIFTDEVDTWDEVVDTDVEGEEIIVYGRSDASAAYKKWGAFLGEGDEEYTQSELNDASDGNFDGDQQVAEAVDGEENAIAMNNVNYIWDFETGELDSDVRPVPIDLDGDGTLGEDEDFYDDRSTFLDAVDEGEYPSPPARDMFLATINEFEGEAYDFVEWVLSDEQQDMVRENGYVPISEEKLEAQRQRLDESVDQ